MFPEISEVMGGLSELLLDETAIKELPLSIKNLTGLALLNLRGCRKLQGLPSSIHLRSLKTLNLSGCSNVQKFQDISEVMKEFSELYLDGTGIKELSLSIQNLTGLVILNLKGCLELKSLPKSICHLKHLRYLTLSGCSNFDKFPEISVVMNLSELYLDETAIRELPLSIQNLEWLCTLNLKGCLGLESLPSSICHLKHLRYVILSGCSNFEKFPGIAEVMNLSELYLDETAIKELHPSIQNLEWLCILNLKGCLGLKSLPTSICHLKHLRYVTLSGCPNFEKFPDISAVMNLSELYLDETAIRELPSSIQNLEWLCTLNLKGCLGLKSLPISICHLKHLRYVILSGCSNFEKFPGIAKVMNLSELYLDETAIRELPPSIQNLEWLCTLNLKGCVGLKSLPSSICHLKHLRYVTLSGCSNFEKFPEISKLMNVLELHLDETAIEELPYSIKNLIELVTLNLKDCRELKSLPSSICELKSLRYVICSGCPKLEVLPKVVEGMLALKRV